MSEIVIYFNPLRRDSAVTYQAPAGTALIDFLQAEFPTGFDGVLHVLVNMKPLDLSNLDYKIQDGERVIMLVAPGAQAAIAAWNYVYPYLVQALVAAAVGLAVSLIFAPDAPKGFDGGEESPVYSINATQNRARLGEPIASHYGTVTFPPDYGAAPYVFYDESSSDMYVDELLDLGHGEYIIHEVTVGETPVDALEPGAVRYWVYGPDDHNQTLGTIEADIWSQIASGPNPKPFVENMFTSPEVESWEFNDDRNDEVSTPAAFAGRAFAAGGGQLGRITEVDSSLDIGPGDTITLANTVSNNVSFVVAFAVVDSGDPTKMTLFEGYGSSIIQDEDPLPGATTYTLNTTTNNMIAGPFRAQKGGMTIDAIDVDILFPQGLMTIEGDGDQRYRDIEIQVTYQQINPDTGAAIGAPIVNSKTYRYKTRRPVRDTISSGPLAPGAYEVTVQRLTAFAGRGLSPEQTIWAGLKGHVVLDATATAYGPVTLMALRMKATNGLGQAARSRVKVTATRVLASGDSDNPITVIKDIWLNTDYGMKRSLEELDTAALDALEAEWDTEPSFNGSFDSRNTGFEAMQSVISLAGARVLHQNALITVVPDRVQAVRTAMFGMANILPDSFELTYTFDTEGDFDGVRVEYRDPTTFNPAYAVYPEDAEQPEAFTLFGCTSASYAQQFATYLWNTRTRRRKAVKFDTELEGLIPLFGDRIGVSHAMPDWGQSGVILEQLGTNTYRVDQALDWQSENIVLLRDEHGKPNGPYTVTVGATKDIIVFDTAPGITVATPGNREPTLYSFGRTYELIKDFMVTKITPQSDRIIRIEGQLYDEAIYSGAPAHMGGV
ncbi:host specificity factor TipJ family phage tail protein [Parahaliea mediterranea]|uniref:host specificity factor TipJ family phage tail protein n=1 Tax=Parahaliea mediterranea TaxID=651086 RepID=UPI001300744A|nr:host specificity factor TipJ family phage tail protein [Parahaliea mediterranea]